MWVWSLCWDFLGKGNGKLLQYSCLGSPMDGGAWWATVHGGGKRVGQNLAIEKWQCIYSVNYHSCLFQRRMKHLEQKGEVLLRVGIKIPQVGFSTFLSAWFLLWKKKLISYLACGFSPQRFRSQSVGRLVHKWFFFSCSPKVSREWNTPWCPAQMGNRVSRLSCQNCRELSR